MATDENVSDAVKLKAITEALDRGGVMTKSSVDVDVSVKPHESIFEQMMSGSRASYRGEDDHTRALVASDYNQLPPTEDKPIDVFVVDDLDGDSAPNLNYATQPTTPDERESGSPFDRTPPAEGLMPLDQANAVLVEQRRRAAAGHTQVHRGQRALPPGKSARR